MIFQYGSYAHDDAEVWFRFEAPTIYSEIGRRQNRLARWTITGVKKADSIGELTSAMQALEAAYSVDGGDVQFFDNNGGLLLPSTLSSNTVDGVQVKSFRYLPRNEGIWGSGTEYVNKKTFEIVLEGLIVDCPLNVVSWRETVQGVGTGGPKFLYKGALTGPPQKQTVQQQTSFTSIQQGEAVGYFEYPTPATPLFPQHEHVGRRRLSLWTPKFGVNRNTLFKASWSYQFESSSQLLGSPSGF